MDPLWQVWRADIRYSGHGDGRGSVKPCRRHAGGSNRKLLLIAISDGERTGLSANPGKMKKKTKTGKVFGLLMIRGMADNQALIRRLGNVSQRDWLVLSV